MCEDQTTAINPYAAPRSAHDAVVVPSEDLWRDGKLLVTPSGADLPDRCIKCNAAAEGRRRTLKVRRNPITQCGWLGPAVFAVGAVIAMSLPLGLITALASYRIDLFTPEYGPAMSVLQGGCWMILFGTLQWVFLPRPTILIVGVCKLHGRLWHYWDLVTWSFAAVVAGLAIGSFIGVLHAPLLSQFPTFLIVALGVIVLFLAPVGILITLKLPRIRFDFSEKRLVWLSGFDRDFLASLPKYEHGVPVAEKLGNE